MFPRLCGLDRGRERPGRRPDSTSGRRQARPRLGTIVSAQLLPFLRTRADHTLVISEADDAEMTELLDDFYKGHELSPLFAGGGFEAILARSTGLRVGDYLIARHLGELVACVGMWDQTAFRRTRVMHVPLTMRLLLGVARAGGWLREGPFLPRQGELLRCVFARHPAHRNGHADALNALMRAAIEGLENATATASSSRRPKQIRFASASRASPASAIATAWWAERLRVKSRCP